ncbi:hypothetical protein [Streptomyces sp. NPDC000983]|uniref:hypothetical protein n=1 Tax=Streptomyces sp. NPDC000983 TaxID=3154373 RepID=UPI00331B8B09
MGRWWGRKRTETVEEAVPPPRREDRSVRGTLAGRIDGSAGPRAVTLSVLDAGLALAVDGDAASAAAPREYGWAEVTHVWFANDLEGHEVEGDAVSTRWIYDIRLEFTDGTVVASRLGEPPVVTPGALFRSGRLAERPESDIWPLLAHIRTHVTEERLAEVESALAAGGQVEFGPLIATADGLGHEGTLIPWQDITVLRYSFIHADTDPSEIGAFLRIEYRDPDAGQFGFPFRWLRIPALEVPDTEALERLAARLRE